MVVGLDFLEIEKKLKEMYGPYISEPWFDSFVQHYFMNLSWNLGKKQTNRKSK